MGCEWYSRFSLFISALSDIPEFSKVWVRLYGIGTVFYLSFRYSCPQCDKSTLVSFLKDPLRYNHNASFNRTPRDQLKWKQEQKAKMLPARASTNYFVYSAAGTSHLHSLVGQEDFLPLSKQCTFYSNNADSLGLRQISERRLTHRGPVRKLIDGQISPLLKCHINAERKVMNWNKVMNVMVCFEAWKSKLTD